MNSQSKPSIDEQIRNISRNKLPSRDLWTGIEHSLTSTEFVSGETNKLKSETPFYALVAGFCVVALVGYFSFQTGINATGQELVSQMSEQHYAQKQALLTSLEGQLTTTQNWQQQLDELDKAAMAIKKALKNEPNNAALLKMLKRVHEQQIGLIERVHAPAWQRI